MNPPEEQSRGEPPRDVRDDSVVRELIKHENELVNHRLTWFITLQGLLFAALGFAWDKADSKGLIFVFCGLGVLSAASTATVLHGGAMAVGRLSKSQSPSNKVIGRIAPWYERVIYPWYAFPVLFALGWLLIVWLNWSR